ncbi:FAD-dependent oxidoreductase [Nonomuraea rhizosphaerae]|uniref:FAD-dependent oxidoreductase n=1 Tax=Nonomuraea rhizosphaerae TaxID=2665663 RepID=UPI001C5DFB01|nr:NAD(P)/FAD-dependent oxidoreductase [Nonomuraea rhizosphaerae]
MHILIIGGGIGGLCLAQGLKRAGIGATVHDCSPTLRGQGWRLSVKEEGVKALRACLPADLFDRLRANAIRPADRMAFMDHLLVPKFVKPIPPTPGGFGINRLILRDTLLTGLDVRFGAPCTGYDGTTARFADGTSASGDLIVGADGTGSAVRAQLLPDAVIEEVGRALYGVTPFTTLDWVPGLLVDTFNRMTNPDGFHMAVATCRPGDYFTWTISGPHPEGDPHDVARELVAGWHPAVRRVVAEATTVFPVRLRSALPVEPWDDPHVTLLGDAVHTMTPGRGEGATVALRDARLLTVALTDAAAGNVPLPAAKALYEQEMLRYGFEAVAASRHAPFAPKGRDRDATTHP